MHFARTYADNVCVDSYLGGLLNEKISKSVIKNSTRE